MWEDSSYFWLVLCKNHWFHARKNFFFRHQILLAETDAFASRPPVNRPFKVRCDECGKEYVYKVTEVLRVEHEPPESFTPHPLFRDEADPYPGKSEPEKSQSNIGSPMQIERRRATRHLFGIAAEVINVESQAQITSLARDLNLYGCFVTSKAPFPKGTEVRLTITKSQTNFSAVGRVAFNGHPIHSRTPFVSLDSCQCLLAVLPLADFLHQPFANGRAFSSTLRRERFGPFLSGCRSFTPTLLREGQH
jgi:hypothetical protein